MKIWVDSECNAPDDSYVRCISVDDAIATIEKAESENEDIQIVDLGRIASDDPERSDVRLDVLYWMQDYGKPYTVMFHSKKDVVCA